MSDRGPDLILKAAQFAVLLHNGQTRDYTAEPYAVHVLRVAEQVAKRTTNVNTIAAAILHDVVEDTETTPQTLYDLFGETVTSLVLQLTDVYTSEAFPDLNRAQRKALEAGRIGNTSAEAQLIKAYDLLDNTRNIVEHDPSFAQIYLAEKRDVVAKMTKLEIVERALLEERLYG